MQSNTITPSRRGPWRAVLRGAWGAGYSAHVLRFFFAFFLLFSSGRIDSIDPKAQLQAAMAVVHTGRLGLEEPPITEPPNLWVKSAGGLYYQAHDIGATAFMIPAAWLGSRISPAPAAQQIKEPPWPSRFAVALGYASLGALGCFFLFRLFANEYPPRTAFLLALAFATTTIFWAYTKNSYDVLGACVGVCALLGACSDALKAPRAGARDAVRIGLAFAAACSFRFSLTPFLLAGLLAMLLSMRAKMALRHAGLCLALVGLGLLPSLAYNYVRTAAPLHTAATGHAPPSAALQGNMAQGLYGLFLTPNRGLLTFAPIFLLLLIVPLVWREIPDRLRRMIACFGLSAALYALAIAKLNYWAAIGGWGPRYLVPILPILFLGVAAVTAARWRTHKRLLTALLLLSAALNAVPVLVNYSWAAGSVPGATDPHAPLPRQQMAAWRGLSLGLRRKPLPAPEGFTVDPIRRLGRNFPDLWTARLIEYSPRTAVAGTVIALSLLVAAAGSLVRLLREGAPGGRDGT